ncbi:transposase family protein [Streptomyces sp. NPDC050743]|uniref:transposase family protein n=1 Tax=Streptomyces sp. NPDC050743 TaxID=3365634 RepID=UPI00379A02EE
MLEKLGPLDADRIADLRPYLESVPDPRSRRGRWYSLTAILLVCACAAVCGAKSIDELAEFGERATNTLLASLGVRRHPASPRPRKCPGPDRGRSSPWTERPSRARPAWIRRAVTCCRRSPTTASPRSPR